MASVDSPSILPGRLTGTGTDKIAVVPRKSVKRLFVQAKLKLHHNGARLLPLCAFVTMMAISFLLFDIFSANPTSVAVADAYPWFDDMDDVGDERYYSHFLSEMDDDSVESRYPPASGDSSDNSPFGHFRIDFRAGTGKVSGRRRGRRRVPPAVHRRAAMRRRMRIDLLALAALGGVATGVMRCQKTGMAAPFHWEHMGAKMITLHPENLRWMHMFIGGNTHHALEFRVEGVSPHLLCGVDFSHVYK